MNDIYEFLDEIDQDQMKGKKEINRWACIVDEFVRNDKKYCLISFKNKKERNSCFTSMSKYIKVHDLDITIGNYGVGHKIYLAKA